MYDTTMGVRVLHGAEAHLFAHGVWMLTDDLRNFIPESNVVSLNHFIGIPVLDPLTASQVLVLIDRVSGYLLDPMTDEPERTAVLDAVIAAVFQKIQGDVESEIEMQTDLGPVDDDDTLIRSKVAAASAQTAGPQGSVFDTPDPESVVMETWADVIERLCDRVLPDEDWGLESHIADSDPLVGDAIKNEMGIDQDYFIETVPDASVEQAATAWQNTIERVSGWRPEKWRFGCGLPQPQNVSIPARVDVRYFPENAFVRNEFEDLEADDREPGFQQKKPVLLADLMREIDAVSDQRTAYVNRRTGEVVGVRRDVLDFLDSGEYSERYFGDATEDCLELGRTVNADTDFVRLPRDFKVHEWSTMRKFCESIDDEIHRDELFVAVRGSDAIEVFQATVERLNLLYDWRQFQEMSIEGWAVRWLEERSITCSRTEPGEDPF